MRDHLRMGEQIKLAQSNHCIFIKNFVIGFCKIYLPQSEISMHVLSQSDPENKVIWVVDAINGDEVWENNIDVSLYTDSGSIYHGSYQYGPVTEEYLNVGDQITIQPDADGYFSFRFKESISGDVLFESPLVKY
jgi:hypothetical protein